MWDTDSNKRPSADGVLDTLLKIRDPAYDNKEYDMNCYILVLLYSCLVIFFPCPFLVSYFVITVSTSIHLLEIFHILKI
jgi:hypothetical protein